MGSSFQNYRAALGDNRCPAHPSEPVIGMCGCGALICRRCSPSTVFCASCYEKRHRIAAVRAVSFVHPGLAQAAHHSLSHGYAHTRHLPPRIFIESLLLALIAILTMTGLALQGHSLATARSAISYGIDTSVEPSQRNTPLFETSISAGGTMATLTSDASYSISARVESTHAYNDSISAVVPEDLLLAWGQMADPDNSGSFSWEQADRHGTVSGTLGGDLTPSYVISHVSNNHLVPADNNIRHAISTIKPGDTVRIDGRLVDLTLANGSRALTVVTSKTRSDQGDGACEIVYVQHIRINDRSY